MPRNVYIYDPNVPVPKKVRHVEIPRGITVIKNGVFSNCSNLKSIIIPDSVTKIDNGAFWGCSALQSVTLPDSVTEIGTNAFRECLNLQSVTIPDSVTKIGYSAFSSCFALQSVTIPDSVTEISDHVFYDCSSLRSVTIPDSVTEIGNGAFNGCFRLQSIKIPNSVKIISDGVFAYCQALQTVTIPDSVTAIDNNAFAGCRSLQSVTIPEGVTEIGDNVFRGCSDLKSITIPDSVTKIGDYAFCHCDSLQSVAIPDGVTQIGLDTFDGCSGLQSVIIPDSIMEICIGAFRECSGLQSVKIPDGITKISKYSFDSCSGLQSIRIPDGVTEIGDGAFQDCSGLQSVVIPDSVTKIGNSAFRKCSGLQSVTIPDGVTGISNNVFYGCSSLRSVTIPGSAVTIGAMAFGGCSALQSVIIPEGVTEIGAYAFVSCSGLQSVTIPGSVEMVGKNSFLGCSNLHTVTVSDGVAHIGKCAFERCPNLQSVTIPDSVTEISLNAFHHCSNLRSIMYKSVNIAPFINVDGNGVNTFDVIKVLIGHQVPLNGNTVRHGIEATHRGRLLQWVQEYPIFGNMRFPAAAKRVSEQKKEQLRKCFTAHKRTKGHVPEILNELAITVRICRIPPERLTETFDIEYTRCLLSEKIPIVPATACRCYYDRGVCDMLIRKGKISVMAEAIGLYNRSGHQECYRHLTEFIRSHPDTRLEDLQYAVDHATEIPIEAKTTLTQIKRHRIYMENLAEVTKIETKYGKVVPGFRLSDCQCNLNPTGITYDGMTARALNLSDARDIALAARLGELTNCCQRLKGAGETAMMHGFLNPDAGFWVIEDKDGRLKAQAEIWKAGPNTLVFDNIEFANTDDDHLTDRAEHLRGVIAAWAMESDYENIIMGCGFNELGTETMEQAPIPELCLTPEEVFILQKGNDAGMSFGNIDEAHRYMQTEEYNPNNFVYTDADKKCVYIKKDGIVSDYLMQGYDCGLADKYPASGHETAKERDNDTACK